MNIEPPTETTAALGAAKPPPVTLLIVDDDDEIRESIRLVFADAADTGSIPYTVLEASNGDEALTIELLPKPCMLEDLEQAVDRARQRRESRRPAFSLSLSRRRRP